MEINVANIKPRPKPVDWEEVKRQTEMFLAGQSRGQRVKDPWKKNHWLLLSRKETLLDHEIAVAEKQKKLKELCRRTKDESRFVYVIGQFSGPIKVGIASDVESRLSGLQTGHPYELRIFLSIDARTEDVARALEKQCHSSLSYCRLRGEWFELGAVEAVEFVQRAADGFGLSEKG